MNRWVPRTDKRRVNDPHGGELAAEVERLQRDGFHKIILIKERFKDNWHIEAVKFDREEG
jgi:hypothetical protein